MLKKLTKMLFVFAMVAPALIMPVLANEVEFEEEYYDNNPYEGEDSFCLEDELDIEDEVIAAFEIAIGFNASQRGWVWRNGNWFYYNVSGQLHHGLLHNGNNWYFLNNQGIMQTGWVSYDGNWYFFNPRSGQSGHVSNLPHGAMRTGWVWVNGNWYFQNPRSGQSGHTSSLPHGAMRTGWVWRNGNWYFLNPSSGQSGHASNLPHGAMHTGWLERNGLFFLNSSGRMQRGWTQIDGIRHYFMSSGHWIMREAVEISNILSEERTEMIIENTGIRVTAPRSRIIGLGNEFDLLEGVRVEHVANNGTVTSIPITFNQTTWFWSFSHNGQTYCLRIDGRFDNLVPGVYERTFVVHQGDTILGQSPQTVTAR